MTKAFVDRDTVNDDTVIIRKVYVQSGGRVEKGTLVLEYETSKTSVESNAMAAGVIALSVKEGDEVPVGAFLYEVEQQGDAQPVNHAREPEQITAEPPGPVNELRLSRAAAAVAERLRVGLEILPSGGWVTAADVERAAGILKESNGGAQSVELSGEGDGDGERDVPRSPVPYNLKASSLRKRAESRNLADANSHGSVSTLGMALRLNGARLVSPPVLFLDSISDLVTFEGSRLLHAYPELNAFYIDDRRIGQFQEVNFGVAFDSGANLKVLTIRNADKKKLCDIQLEFGALLELYESEKPIPDELLSNSTVTLSDISATNVSFVQPLINGRQSLIIGIARGERGFSLYASFDHRVTEGLTVARFLEHLCETVQSHFSDAAPAGDFRCAACEKSLREEAALGHRGLIRILLPNGHDGLLCRSCFEGI